jgi:DNA-binding transcriptional regulator/RsmH inhibitor MraZ
LSEQVADLNIQFRTGKTDSSMDRKQGRVSFENHLLDYAGIDKDVTAVRAGAYWRLSPPPSTELKHFNKQ